jgi:rhodanese-related sulfurtransferase
MEKGGIYMKISHVLLAVVFLLTSCSNNGTFTDTVKEPEKTDKSKYISVSTETTDTKSKQFKSVSSVEAEKMISDGKVLVIDVRSPESFLESHLPSAQNIPLKEIEAKNFNLDKNESYLIVCKAGKTSEIASTLLSENGFKNINNLIGGMDSWTGSVVKSQ